MLETYQEVLFNSSDFAYELKDILHSYRKYLRRFQRRLDLRIFFLLYTNLYTLKSDTLLPSSEMYVCFVWFMLSCGVFSFHLYHLLSIFFSFHLLSIFIYAYYMKVTQMTKAFFLLWKCLFWIYLMK